MNLKEVRRGMMVLVNTIDKLAEQGDTSRELNLSRTSAQRAMMWCGTLLKESGIGDNPYAGKDGQRTTVEDIEPMFDATSETLNSEILAAGLIVTVDQMREYLGNQISACSDFVTSVEYNDIVQDASPQTHFQVGMAGANLYTSLVEARMWLGMELGRIRDNS